MDRTERIKTEIEPLMDEVGKLCEKYNISFVAHFQGEYDGDEDSASCPYLQMQALNSESSDDLVMAAGILEGSIGYEDSLSNLIDEVLTLKNHEPEYVQ